MRFDFVQLGNLLENGDLLEIQDGNHGELHPKASDYVKDGIPFVMASNLRNGKVDVGNCSKIPASIYKKLRIGFAKPGDILLSHKGTVGEVAVVDESTPELMLTPQVTYYRPSQNSRRLTPTYLYQVFRSPLFQGQLQKVSAQSTRAYVGVLAQRKLTIPLPSFGEQKKIAEILSTWDRAIELMQVIESRVASMIPTVVSRLLEDAEDIKRIRDVSIIVSKGSTPTTYGHEYTDRGIKFLRVENITDAGTLDFSDVKFISEETHLFLKRSILQTNDILFSIAGAIGRTAVVQKDDLPLNTNQAVAFIRPDTALVRSEFVRLALATYSLGGQISRLQAGNAQKNYNLEQVGNIEIPLFSLERQDEITKTTKTIYQNLQQTSRITMLLRKQKQGLMQKLLTGKMRVKV